MGKIGYNDWSNTGRKFEDSPSDKVTFFSLKEDGEATVRFVYDTVNDIEITAAHLIKTPSLKYGRYVDCFRESAQSPIEDCPLCKAGYEVSNRFYVKLVQYVKDDKGEIVAMPKVWDRAAGYAKQIANLIQEYGSLKDCVFKIKRSGTGLSTEYSIMLASPMVFKDENYPKNFKAFENFDASKYIHRSKDDIEEFLKTGELPAYKKEAKKEEAKPKEEPKVETYTNQHAVSQSTSSAPSGISNTVPYADTSRKPWEKQSDNNNSGFRPNRYY